MARRAFILTCLRPNLPRPNLISNVTRSILLVLCLGIAIPSYAESCHSNSAEPGRGPSIRDLASPVAVLLDKLKASKGDPQEEHRLRVQLGEALEGEGRLEAGISQYRRAVVLKPADALAYGLTGRALYKKSVRDKEFRRSVRERRNV